MNDPRPSDEPFYKWFLPREFWYDTTKSVVGGVVLAVILYAFAVFVGLVQQPDTRGRLLFGVIFLVYAGYSVVETVVLWRERRRPALRAALFIAGVVVNFVVPPLILYVMLFHRNIV